MEKYKCLSWEDKVWGESKSRCLAKEGNLRSWLDEIRVRVGGEV